MGTTATKPRTAAAARPAQAVERMLGSSALRLDGEGGTGPAGFAHIVDESWKAICGDDERVRYVFPGRDLESADELCGGCAAALRRARPARSRKVA